ncbi:hypothetical protein GOP47_0000147 [Adiantum capillus-veneris]|uniref:Uncharacterized protein n=1 Tax=Adiantum capillus-veneris TaxID=13818 RepID=A0A9D4ZQG2_ADICA|nr:hypothetical protein GOP47_0000147 [Adiantum capillus-veneris]
MAVSSSASKQTVNPFLRSWAWKREHRPDKDRFDRPYIHKMVVDGCQHTLSIIQAPFSIRGFASTVWDSAIVLSKYLERWPLLVNGKRCIELGAGCGLPGITAAYLGAAHVLLTDLSENLPLLNQNVLKHNLVNKVSVAKLEWGQQADLHNIQTYDVILAADIMYDASLTAALLTTVRCIALASTRFFLAYGRNRQAEETFFEQTKQWFSVEKIDAEKLDDIYQCVDVDVFVMQKRRDL